MRSENLACSAGFVVLLLMTAPCLASDNQTFAWGVSGGGEYAYTLYTGVFDLHGNDAFSVRISEPLPEIPAHISNWSEIPEASSLRWANGTDIEHLGNLLPGLDYMILPVGNWSLLSDLIELNTSIQDLVVWDSDPESWTYSFKFQFAVGVVVVLVANYFRDDGVLKRYQGTFRNASSGLEIGLMIASIQLPAADTSYLIILYSAYLGVLIAAFIAFAVYVRRIHKSRISFSVPASRAVPSMYQHEIQHLCSFNRGHFRLQPRSFLSKRWTVLQQE